MPNRYEMQRRASTRTQAKAVPIDARKFKQKRALSWAIIAVTTAITLLMPATFARAATVKSKRGYSISAPAGWKVVQSGMMGTDLVLLAPKANNFQPNVNVIVQPLPSGMNLKRGRAELDRVYPKMFAGFKWIGRGTAKVGGATGLLNVASHNMGTPARKLLMYQVIVPHGRNYYSMTGTSLLSQSAKFKPQFAAILRSVHWTK